MSSIPGRSPTQSRGFQPLRNEASYGDMTDEIPLTQVRTNHSTGARRDGYTTEGMFQAQTHTQDAEKRAIDSREGGRRKLKRLDSKSRSNTEPAKLTGLGKVYKKIINFSPVVRHIVYILPIGALIAIPIIVGATTEAGKKAFIAHVRLVWFFTWIEVVWLSIWVAKLFAQLLPAIFMFLCGVVSSGTRKYALVIKALEIPISLVLWAATGLATFQVLMVNTAIGNEPEVTNDWRAIFKNILAPLLISAGIYLGEKSIIQLISISYHQRSFDGRIKESKRAIHLIGLLYDASRTLFPMYCREFEEEDILINDSIEALLYAAGKKGHRRSGSNTPMVLLAGIGKVGDKITSAFGNIASEISGKQVFNPNSAHSIVVEALEKKRSSEALAKRLWMSFVVEGRESLYLDDFQEVLGPSREVEAQEAFEALDTDGNGDISLDEMIMKVVQIGRDRKAIANSMRDVGQAIGVLDQILVTVVLVISVFVIVAFLNANFVTTLATAGTTLLSLSFVFAVTTQEFLGSCIFLFVKHPYDVGDRVDIVGPSSSSFIVDQISLLYTVFKRVDNMKMVQVPNIVLNGLWVENVSRSKAMKEQLEMFISFDTSLEDIELLRTEMEAFVRHPDNSRDFQNDIILECTGIGEMNKLVLKVEIKHKSNWHNETVRAARRSKFMCALVLALRKVPIYAPGGGSLALGDPGNPSYSVAISDKEAAEAREKAKETKEAKRLVPTHVADAPKDVGEASGVDIVGGTLGSQAESAALTSMNLRSPVDDAGRDDWEDHKDAPSLPALSTEIYDGLRRRETNSVSDLRASLLKRQSTKGKRRAGEALPPLSMGMPGLSMTSSNVGGTAYRGDGTPIAEEDSDGSLNGRDLEAGYEAYRPQNTYGAPAASANPYSIFPTQQRSDAGGAAQVGRKVV